MTVPKTFMQNQTADGEAVIMIKGRRTVLVWGTWNGATVTIGYRAPDNTLIELEGGTFTENGSVLALPEDSHLPLVAKVIGASAGTDLNVMV